MNGRVTLCTTDMIETIAQTIEDGLSIEKACDLAGISHSSFKGWRRRGEAGEEPYLSFLSAIKIAFARRTQKRIKRITEAALDRVTVDKDGATKIVKGDWQAQAWLEERQNRSEFGRYATKVELSDPPAGLTEMQKVLFLSDDLMSKLRCGDITAEGADVVSRVLEQRRKLLEASDYEQRLRDVEIKLAGSN